MTTKTQHDAEAAAKAIEKAYAKAETPKHVVRPVADSYRRGTRIA